MQQKHRNVSNSSPFNGKHKFIVVDDEDKRKHSPTNILDKPGKMNLGSFKDVRKIPIAGRLTDLGSRILTEEKSKIKHITTLNWGAGFKNRDTSDNFSDEDDSLVKKANQTVHYTEQVRQSLRKKRPMLINYAIIKPQQRLVAPRQKLMPFENHD